MNKINNTPDEALREHFTINDGYLCWNPELADLYPRRVYYKPIGVDRAQKFPTVFVDGKMYHVHRLNYWMHTGEYPECVIYKDPNSNDPHIDNLTTGLRSEVRARAKQKKERTYQIRETTYKSGRKAYFPSMKINGVIKGLGSYPTREEAREAAKTVHWLIYRSGKAPDLVKGIVKNIAVQSLV